MLSLMRQHAQSWLIKIILGVITIVFVFWGVGSYTSSRASRVAVVNGRTISISDYESTYRRLMENARRQYGQALNEDLVKALNLRQQALESLVQQELALEAADKAGVYISDEALKADLHSKPAFQENGQFSPRRYISVLNSMRLQPAEYEESLRRDLALQQIFDRPALAVVINPSEAKLFYHGLFDKVKVSYVAFDPANYKDKVKVDDKAMEQFFQANREDYRIPEKVTVEYLSFLPKDFTSKVKVDPAEVKEYYEIGQDNYIEPAQVKLAHIYLKPAKTEEESKAVKAKAEDILKKIKAGEDFAELAKKFSEGAAASKGGELGWMLKDNLTPQLSVPVSALKPGEVTGVVETEGGFHILKLEEKKDRRVKSFEEVKDQITKKISLDLAREAALEAAETAYGLSAGATGLEELAKQIQTKAHNAGPFSRQDPGEGVPADQAFIAAAFDQKIGEVGSVIESPDGYYLIMVKKKTPSYLPELKEVAEAVKSDYVDQEAKKLAKKAAEELFAKAKAGDWLEICAQEGAEVMLPDPFTRREAVQPLGYSAEFNAAAFKLSPKNVWPDKVQQVAGKFVVFRFEMRLPASDEVFAKQKDEIIGQLAQQRGREFAAAWVQELKAGAEIKFEERFAK